LPVYFRTETHISGVMATDLHTLNTVLGATIEEQVVRTLNLLRNTWDPTGQYALYSFVRQPQTFPDVRLKKASGDETLLGIELKGWYLLSKEGEPSLRFQATAAACETQDLIVVVPWVLGNVISGSPILFEPFIESARLAAEFRNYHWQHVRQTAGDTSIVIPAAAKPYPSKPDQILDKPRSDRRRKFRPPCQNGHDGLLHDQAERSVIVRRENGILARFFEGISGKHDRNASSDSDRSPAAARA
jgi:hypothetical protein